MPEGRLIATERWLIVLILFGYGYFYNAHNWNHISRFDGIFAFVENDTPNQYSFRIDHLLVSPVMGRNTGDWARNAAHDGHYYSNKAPGVMLLGVPVYALLYHVESFFGVIPESHAWTRINTYLLNFALSVMPAAWAAVLFFRLARRRLGLFDREALALTGLLFFGTLIFPYATQLWGHTTAAAFLVASLGFLLGDTKASAAWSGALVGLAVLAEYSAAIPLIGMLGLLAFEKRGERLPAFVLGGLPAFAVHLLYHRAVFGNGLTVASFYNNPKFHEAEKVAGIFGGLAPDVILGLSVSTHHGLFFFTPILLLIIPALILVFARSAFPLPLASEGRGGLDRRLVLLALWVLGGFVAMNLSFNGWHGGFCLGPRYLIPSLPFMVVLLVPIVVALRGRAPLALGLVALLAGISLTNMSLLAMRAPTTTFLEEGRQNPLADYYRDFLAGRLGAQRLSPIRLDGEWAVAGRVMTQRNGVLVLADEEKMGRSDWPRAEAFIQLSKPDKIRLVLAWQGDLGLRVNDTKVPTPHHAEYDSTTIPVNFESGENALAIDLRDSATGRFSFFALASQGRPRYPRAARDAEGPVLTGSNFGNQLGLEGVASVVPWFLGLGLIGLGLRRALSRADAVDL